MSEELPTHDFKWVSAFSLTIETIHKLLTKKSTKRGYLFEVDLEYPKELWDLHNDYPVAPERLAIGNVEKLVGTFLPKNRYVLHYKNLKQYLSLGLKLKAVHRVISFRQSRWMEPYIAKNTSLKMSAKNEFDKDFFKSMNNSVFGKTIENIRQRQNIKIIDNRATAMKLSSKPNFQRCTIFDENLVAVHMTKTSVTFDKPIYVGQAVLDLSKSLMFDFHYNYMRKKHGDKAELLFTDTDSLMYEIQTEDFYSDIAPDVRARFDTSDYPKDHPSGIEVGVNKKVIGMFKDEAAGKQITHFLGLRAKL